MPWFFLLHYLVCCWCSKNFSVLLLYTSAPEFELGFFYSFYIFIKLLILFMHCIPDFILLSLCVLLHIIELNTIFQVLFRAICMSQFLWDSLVELIFVFFGGVKLFVWFFLVHVALYWWLCLCASLGTWRFVSPPGPRVAGLFLYHAWRGLEPNHRSASGFHN